MAPRYLFHLRASVTNLSSLRTALTLPWKMVNGVKVFHLIAEPVTHEFASGLVAECWVTNGRVHRPPLSRRRRPRRIYVTNVSPPTSVHWHAFCAQRHGRRERAYPKSDSAGRDFQYEYTRKQHALSCTTRTTTRDTDAARMIGLFVIHPKNAPKEPPIRDYAIIQRMENRIGARRPHPIEMTDSTCSRIVNARSFPARNRYWRSRGPRPHTNRQSQHDEPSLDSHTRS